MTEQPQTSEAWRKTVAGLRERREKAEAKAQEIDARRGEFVLAAMTGNEGAQAKLEDYDARIAEVRREAADLERASHEAEAALQEAERREADARRQRDATEAQKLEARAAKTARRVDENVRRIAGDAEEVEKLLSRAARLRRGSRGAGGVTTRVQLALRAAYWHAGLKVGDYVQATHRRPFAEGLAALLGLARPADDEEEETA